MQPASLPPCSSGNVAVESSGSSYCHSTPQLWHNRLPAWLCWSQVIPLSLPSTGLGPCCTPFLPPVGLGCTTHPFFHLARLGLGHALSFPQGQAWVACSGPDHSTLPAHLCPTPHFGARWELDQAPFHHVAWLGQAIPPLCGWIGPWCVWPVEGSGTAHLACQLKRLSTTGLAKFLPSWTPHSSLQIVCQYLVS